MTDQPEKAPAPLPMPLQRLCQFVGSIEDGVHNLSLALQEMEKVADAGNLPGAFYDALAGLQQQMAWLQPNVRGARRWADRVSGREPLPAEEES